VTFFVKNERVMVEVVFSAHSSFAESHDSEEA